MKLLQELLELPNQLLEAELDDIKSSGAVEIKDLIKAYPNNYKKHLEKLWGTEFLTYKGQKLFSGGHDIGPVYDGAIKASEAAMKKVRIPLEILDEEGNDTEIDCNIDGSQECYLGYKESSDQLYIGYDCWLDEESWNEWARVFDDSDPKIEKGLDKSWKDFNKKTFIGMLFELTTTNGKTFKAEEDDSQDSRKGFYQGTYNGHNFKRLKLIDLRLD